MFLALNNVQWFLGHKTKLNEAKTIFLIKITRFGQMT